MGRLGGKKWFLASSDLRPSITSKPFVFQPLNFQPCSMPGPASWPALRPKTVLKRRFQLKNFHTSTALTHSQHGLPGHGAATGGAGRPQERQRCREADRLAPADVEVIDDPVAEGGGGVRGLPDDGHLRPTPQPAPPHDTHRHTGAGVHHSSKQGQHTGICFFKVWGTPTPPGGGGGYGVPFWGAQFWCAKKKVKNRGETPRLCWGAVLQIKK